MAENVQKKWGAKSLSITELNNVRAIEVGGRNINPDGFILSNASLRNSVKSLYIGIENEMGHGNFEFQVTGGDRFHSRGGNYSSTNNKLITIGDPTAHNIERGARAVDVRTNISYQKIEPLANKLGLKYQKDYYPYNYSDGHHHLYIPLK